MRSPDSARPPRLAPAKGVTPGGGEAGDAGNVDRSAPPVEPRLVRERELAEPLGLGCSSIRRLRARGAIPGAVRIGRSRRYVLAVIRAWVAAGCPPPARWPREWREVRP
jgi:predicted DNA-binding transcriptional regulator AlpA